MAGKGLNKILERAGKSRNCNAQCDFPVSQNVMPWIISSLLRNLKIGKCSRPHRRSRRVRGELCLRDLSETCFTFLMIPTFWCRQ